jgi:1-deoxy-D-xylulose-5-phosphate reductoisomerase
MMPDHPRRTAILGSSGSVGTNALRLIEDRRDRFDVAVLSANRSARLLAEQTRAFRPAAVALVDGDADEDGAVKAACDAVGAALHTGARAVVEALDDAAPDLVLNAITGAAGLPASEWTLRKGRDLALANKESLVVAGPYLNELAARSGSRILPVDSEHCAIFQCLSGKHPDDASRREIKRIWLTASGGPFRTRPKETFDSITREEALKHPTWDMGPRITIGSATMTNKAFEILEAHWLFGVAPEQIEVLVHPQSIVHSMVEFVDGSIIAQLGVPDMRVPILYCLGWPERLPFGGFEPFDPKRFAQLTFEPVDADRFPVVPLAYEVLRRGGDSGAVFNAADEVMTGRFLDGDVRFLDIVETVSAIVRQHETRPIHGLEDVEAADRAGREAARAAVPART